MAAITHIGRPLRFDVASNAAAIVVAVATAAGGLLVADADWMRSLEAGAISLLAWALVREVDPDHAVAAVVCAVAGGLVAVAADAASVGPLYLLVIGARIATRSTGRPPRRLDLAVHIPIAAWVARDSIGLVAVAALAAAVAADTSLPRPARRGSRRWAVAIAGAGLATAALAAMFGSFAAWDAPGAPAIALVSVGLLGGVVLLQRDVPVSREDDGGCRIHPDRLRWSRGLVAVTLMGAAIVGGGDGVTALAPAWAALAIAGAARAAVRLRTARPRVVQGGDRRTT